MLPGRAAFDWGQMILRKIAPALTAGALILAGLSFTSVPAAAAPAEMVSTAAAGDSIDRANQQQIVDVFNGINEFRASLGVAPVTFNATISELAEDWSDNMAVNGFRHNPNFYTDARVVDRWSAAGEIIAYNGESTGESLMVQWIHSESHANLMKDPNYKVMGVGISRNLTGDMLLYGTVNFFTFPAGEEPAGAYTTAQDFFDGKPSIDLVGVTPAAPTNYPASAQFFIPEKQNGVEYYVDDALKVPGFHHSGGKTVRVTAKATAGYYLQGPYTWLLPAQPRTVTAKAPTFDHAAGTYTIPVQEGVRYTVQEGFDARPREVQPGTYAGAGVVMIYVAAAEDFTLDGTWWWNHVFYATEETPTVPTPPVTEPPVTTPPAPEPAFTDAHQSAFQGAIGWMKARDISRGYEDGTYRPFESVSREAMAAFVYRLAGEPDYTAPAVSGFNDVGTGHLFYKEISWMKATGLSTGWIDGTYRPYDLVSREAMAAFMKRYAGTFCRLQGAADFTAPASPTFGDSRGSAFYKEIEWMRVAEVSTGWDDGTYRPFENVSREAMAAFMQRLDTHITAGGGCAL